MFKGIIDTTLRDGQQSPLLFDSYKYSFSLSDKQKLLFGLLNLGVKYIEFFSPVVSNHEKKEFIEIKKNIKAIDKRTKLLAHCRCNLNDINEAITVGFDGLNLYLNGTKDARLHSYNKNLSTLKADIKKIITEIRSKYPGLYLRFSIEDAFRTKKQDLYSIFDEIYGFVNTLGIPDTVGIASPDIVKVLVSDLTHRYPHVDLECHFHNDRGLALINTIIAIESGVSYADTSIWGLAERSGIASTTGVLFNLFQTDKNLVKDYNLALCYPLNVLMGSILHMQVPYNEPVSITNRTHIAGVHHKAVLNSTTIYEAHHLERFGVTKNQLLLGPLTGWNLIYYYLKEFEFFDISQEQAKRIALEFKNQAKKLNERFRPEILLINIANQYQLKKINIKNQYLERRLENLS
ncbi:pyruvate carboxyltransferase [Candidatus Roizmanbacteria bacterium RIFCSPHIGHO2_02_FULL_37_13b]|uniref:Pyruvate carboxyltransferase n=1 Tax=Candidatus Roizmanbacteria bacterium RIFCSPLOWO2_02_FULL_36_11 TaxID=1802071 RepID=A0A1F7JCB7_9BACT|nr:MAG: pyruvate carboxyltransferase [Candidatus Roizmanbacteria bacterium RIFCSPHIGHO2_02_FULL_37_13b]OGK53250.1 MAG: pyruvate carboxyltransferase [Candidatus Roizmanbacteria bacterium RIFCSPLOWO2_02_FULL_36_11]